MDYDVINERAIDNEVEWLLEHEYNIKNFDHFISALDSYALDNKRSLIQVALNNNDAIGLGVIILEAAKAQLEEWAENEAVKRYNDGLLGDGRN